MRQAYERYSRGLYDGVNLWDVYGRYSNAKEWAYDRCRQIMYKYNGKGGVIMTHNAQIFTFAFIGDNPETGEAAFFYITPNYHRYINITDAEG